MVKRPLPRPVGAPGLFPPCIRQRFRPFTAGDKHGVAFRVFAPHREACCSRNVDEEYGDRLWRPDLRGVRDAGRPNCERTRTRR